MWVEEADDPSLQIWKGNQISDLKNRKIKKTEQGHEFWLYVKTVGEKKISWGRLFINTSAKMLDHAGRIESLK